VALAARANAPFDLARDEGEPAEVQPAAKPPFDLERESVRAA
jgi:hypothetical protein